MKKKNKEFSKLYNELCLSYKNKYNQPEEWKKVIINNITTPYIISNYGRIYDYNNLRIPKINYSCKHFYVNIKLDNGSYTIIGIHRLVGLMFIPVPQKYFDAGYTIDELVVDHIRDGDPDNHDDNTIWNLQWLTRRENTSKALKCGYRDMYAHDFREKLDQMILEGYGNKEIYEMCEKDYGYPKEEMKAQIQVRRRRLDKTLKEHHENSKDFTAQLDECIRQGMTNDEIIKKFNMDETCYNNAKKKSKNPARRLLTYRRECLGIYANVSKYFTNEQSKEIYELFDRGLSNTEIIKYFNLDNLDKDDLNRVKGTLASRRIQYIHKKEQEQNVSSTTIET